MKNLLNVCKGIAVFVLAFLLISNTSKAYANNDNAPVGYLEGTVNSSILSGWAADKDDVSSPVNVHIYVDGAAGSGGTYLGSATANMSRPDVLANAGISGNHGFHFQIPTTYQDSRPHSYYVYGIDLTPNTNNILLNWAPKTFTVNPTTSTGGGNDGNTSGNTGSGTLQNNNRPVGYLENLFDSSLISGWAADKDDVTRPIEVHFYIDGGAGSGGLYIGKTLANLSRQDVLVNAGISGNHGFHFQIPAAYQDGKAHSYYAYGIDLTSNSANPILTWAPKSFTVGTVASTGSGSTVVNNNNSYSYGSGYSQYYPYQYGYNNNNNYSSLYVSCLANTSFAPLGSNVVWQANASGGNGYYLYSWSGTDYQGGSGSSWNAVYNYPGTKTASVTVTSGGQSVTQMCSNSVNVNSQYYSNQSNGVSLYNGGLQVACYPDKVNAKVGSSVTWGVEAIGGSGNYAYAWTGTGGLLSTQPTVVMTYGSTGTKSATVTVNSNGQIVTQLCGSTVKVTSATVASPTKTIVNPVQYPNNYQQYNNQNQQDNSLSAASLFSLQNVPWGLVAILVIIVLMFTIMYLLFSRNKI